MDPRASWPALIGALIRGETLTAEECAWAMGEVMDGAATPVQIAGFIVALRAKGETVSEVSGLARAMLEHAAPISVPGPVADLVGTGGDGAHTVNISTMGMITAAAAGARIVKHGNRAASSACGSADVLEALGVVIDLPDAMHTAAGQVQLLDAALFQRLEVGAGFVGVVLQLRLGDPGPEPLTAATSDPGPARDEGARPAPAPTS